jgi:hypothetical protein
MMLSPTVGDHPTPLRPHANMRCFIFNYVYIHLIRGSKQCYGRLQMLRLSVCIRGCKVLVRIALSEK